jgi:DNA-binding MarR family transcriptional regulator
MLLSTRSRVIEVSSEVCVYSDVLLRRLSCQQSICSTALYRYPVVMTTPAAVEADLGWALTAVMRTYLRTTAGALAEVPGGPRGYQVLTACLHEEPPTQLALARRLGLDRTVMTHLLDDLEGAGLVERRPDPADRRARRIVATRAGVALLDELDGRLATVEDTVLAALEPAERRTLRGLLSKAAAAGCPPADACTVAQEMQDAGELGSC